MSGRIAALPNGNGKSVQTETNGTVKNGALRRRPVVSVEQTPEPAVKLVSIVKAYGKKVVLSGVNLAVARGELVEVTGPSGSGKTTLLRLLHGQLRPNAGEVWVRGQGLHRRWRLGLGR